MEIKNVNTSTRGQSSTQKSSTGISSTPGNVPVTKIASSSVLATMTKGSIFAGDIIDVRGNAIKILLAGNETINAKSSNNSSLNIGDYIKFMVKDNTGSQLLIKALNIDNRNTNPLFSALESANIPVNERNMQMVLEMMRNEMPIDKTSINNMYKNISMFENAKAETVVNIVRHEIPLNNENITQFDNYANYEHRISEDIKNIANDIPDTLSEIVYSKDLATTKGIALGLVSYFSDADIKANIISDNIELVAGEDLNTSSFYDDTLKVDFVDSPNTTLNSININEELEDTTLISKNSPNLSEEFDNLINKFNESVSSAYGESSSAIDKLLISKDNVDKTAILKLINSLEQEDLSKLFKTKEFKSYIKNALSKDFNLDITKLTKDGEILKEKIKDLYNSLDDKTSKLLELLKNIPNESRNLSDKLTNIRSNLNFMNEINQMASYVQLPVKFSQNSNHGELYVYNKNRGKVASKEVLTAFMHLDMDNLGMTDVDIRLENNSLTTSFSLYDDESVKIIDEHLDELKDRLIAAGFTVSLSVQKDNGFENPFEKVLNIDKPKMSIKRYSFDVRA